MYKKIIAKLTTTARCFSRSPPAVRRLYSTTTKPPPLPHNHQFNPHPVTLYMIDYAFSFSRSHKSDESYGQGLLVLEQRESNQHDSNSKGLVLLPISKFFSERGNIVEGLEKLNRINGLMVVSFPLQVESYGQVLLVLELCEGNQHDPVSKGLVLLAISTLLSERGNIVEAIEKLNTIKDLEVASFPLKVAATEALAGLHLELGEDDTASVIADGCLNYLDALKAELGDGFRSFDTRARALKGLIELARGHPDSSQSCFKDVEGNLGVGNDALSYAKFLHTTRDFSSAKQLYQKVIKEIPETKDYSDPYNLAAGNMAREDILMAATCALGQLESHMGNFGGAEEILTRALTMTEERFGPHHPKIGVILTCIALMFRHKAMMERSSSLMVQEGLYRRALELLKAPPLETEVENASVCRKDIIALARGGYAETLCVQQNRKATGEQMKSWAEAAWNNKRLSLAEALDISSNIPIIDTRISRAL